MWPKRKSIGRIEFVRLPWGKILEHQQWNPSELTREERTTLAGILRETADAMDKDEFQQNGNWMKFEPAKED